jgi:hypothetical protein
VLWASTGISGAVSGSIHAAGLTRSAVIPPTRAPSIAAISPPTFCPPERSITMNAEIIYAYTRKQPEPTPKAVTFGIRHGKARWHCQ